MTKKELMQTRIRKVHQRDIYFRVEWNALREWKVDSKEVFKDWIIKAQIRIDCCFKNV